jgi:hypothetical protein
MGASRVSPVVDYRSSAHLVRALVEGPAACAAAARELADFDPQGLADFAVLHNLREWLTPLLDDPGGRELLSPAFAAELETLRKEQVPLKRSLLELSIGMRRAFEAAGIPSLFLKGLYFGSRLYGDVHRRHQYDVDVLVPREHLTRALEALAGLGWNATTNLEEDVPVARRLRLIRDTNPERAPHAVTVRGHGVKADIHWCLSSRSFQRLDETAMWARRVDYSLGGQRFDTLCDRDALVFLIVSMCIDLRRGACRAKNFLDLDLLLRQMAGGVDWEAFLVEREREGLLKVAVNVLAIYLLLWGGATAFPELARAVEPRKRLVELRDIEDAVGLVTRPKGNHENRYWFRRVYPRSPAIYWTWRLTRDLPYTLGRLWAPGFATSLVPPPSSEDRR